MNDISSFQLSILPSLKSNTLSTFIIESDLVYWNRFYAYDTSYHYAKLADKFQTEIENLRGQGKLANN